MVVSLSYPGMSSIIFIGLLNWCVLVGTRIAAGKTGNKVAVATIAFFYWASFAIIDIQMVVVNRSEHLMGSIAICLIAVAMGVAARCGLAKFTIRQFFTLIFWGGVLAAPLRMTSIAIPIHIFVPILGTGFCLGLAPNTIVSLLLTIGGVALAFWPSHWCVVGPLVLAQGGAGLASTMFVVNSVVPVWGKTE